MTTDAAESGSARPRPSSRRRLLGVIAFVGVTAGAVLVAPVGLRQLDYFRVQRIEVTGARFVPPGTLFNALALDSGATVWEDLDGLAEKLTTLSQVRSARVERRLPGTLVLHIDENLPVALVATADGLHPFDREGRPLPIDPSRSQVDLPVLARRDTAALRLLDDLRAGNPALFARVSEVRWDEHGGLRVLLEGLTVRADRDCTRERFEEILPVEQDLARRGRRVTELDLRFRDQIVARIE